jgi:hypothetical protein
MRKVDKEGRIKKIDNKRRFNEEVKIKERSYEDDKREKKEDRFIEIVNRNKMRKNKHI